MPVVHVNWWKGADDARRRKLVNEVTETVSRLAECPTSAVTVIVNDVDKDHWAIGGTLASEL